MPPKPRHPGLALASLAVDLGTSAPKEAPKRVRLFRRGMNETSKGIFNFTERSSRECLAAMADHGNKLPFDYGHAMVDFYQADPAEANKAAGWFTLSMDSEGCWAEVEKWTPRAERGILEGEYRYLSPYFRHTPDGEVLEVLNCALTNLPATKHQDSLLSSHLAALEKAPPMEHLAALITALGLAANASLDDVRVAILSLKALPGELLTLTAAKDIPSALGVVRGWQAGAATAQHLSAELTSMRTAADAKERAELIALGTKSGQIAPGSDFAKHAADPVLCPLTTLQAFLKTAPAILPKPAEPPTARPGSTTTAALGLTDEDRALARSFGNDPDDPKVAAYLVSQKKP